MVCKLILYCASVNGIWHCFTHSLRFSFLVSCKLFTNIRNFLHNTSWFLEKKRRVFHPIFANLRLLLVYSRSSIVRVTVYSRSQICEGESNKVRLWYKGGIVKIVYLACKTSINQRTLVNPGHREHFHLPLLYH